MKLRRSLLITFTTLVAGAVAVPGIAAAAFTNGKSNAGNTVAAAALSPVSAVTATALSANSVKLTWTPPSSQAPAVAYKVVNGTTGSTPCSGLPATTTTCTDTGVLAGQSYSYSVVAYIPSSSWTKAPAAVSATTPDAFSVTPSSNQTAGTSFSLSLVAQKATSPTNATLVTDTSYTSSHSITFSGPAASPNGTQPKFNNVTGTSVTTNITFSAGQASSIPTILYNAASTTISASDGAVQGQTSAFTVNPAVGSLSLNSCTVGGTSVACPANGGTINVPKNSSLTATAVRSSTDPYGNGLSLSPGSGSATASAPAPNNYGNFTSPSNGSTVTLTYANNATSSSSFTYAATAGTNGNPVSESISITGPTGWGSFAFATNQRTN